MTDDEANACRTPPASAATRPRRNAPMPSRRLQSPPFVLGSNDDELERAQARAAARAASVRRKSLVPRNPFPDASDSTGEKADILGHDQIMDLFHNCIKLASENKINQKNTWELSLIDHLSEIIRAQQPEDDNETNFQKASCTLEAGVKIYSMRVDSVHSEAYKVLGGINRAGRGEEEKESIREGDHGNATQADGISKKEPERKMSPQSTLESSFDALNVKKFDVAFIVDPLYHQTSAKFDEGGAKGLLLNNLGVYGGCRVLFDSSETPEESMILDTENGKSDLIDLSFAKDHIEKMMRYIPAATDISPTLREIVNYFDEDNRRPSVENPSAEAPQFQDDALEDKHVDFGENAVDNDCGSWNFDHGDQMIDDESTSTVQIPIDHHDGNLDYVSDGADVDDKFNDEITNFLSLGLGLTSKSNAWAGPDHWRYQKVKGLEQVSVVASESGIVEKKPKNKKGVPDIEFLKSLEKEIPDIFAPPKNPKSLLLPANKVACNITLPEDCHYRPESLVKLFLLPDVMCIGRKGRKFSDETGAGDCDQSHSWDNVSMTDEHLDDGNTYSDVEDPGSLVRMPRQVSKVDIHYDKVSKQVDVHALKGMLWDQIQESTQSSTRGCESAVSLTQVLRHFPNDNTAAPEQNISPHLYFICLLHLANEHSLTLHDCPSLDELDIRIPSTAFAE